MTVEQRSTPAYAGMAAAFQAEQVDTYFILLGDGNMHWSAAMSALPGVRAIHVRHENCAVAMAMGYAIASRKVGIASVTCGPGVTQIMTALTAAVHANIPLVVFAGEVPLKSAWYNQTVDQAAMVRSTGAHYIGVHALSRIFEQVREAFYIANMERRPVVLATPFDLQQEQMPVGTRYRPSAEAVPELLPIPPHPESVEILLHKLTTARCPILIAGRGAVAAGAEGAIERLADRVGALLATTLPARGAFDGNAFSLGIAGGFATDVAREVFADCDAVVSFGASLTQFTVDGGRLFPKAFVIQVDSAPKGLYQGRVTADHYIRADARLTAEAMLDALVDPIWAAATRTPELATRIAESPAHSAMFPIPANTVDPREVVSALDMLVPKDWEIVSGTGHSAYFHTQMRGRSPARYHVIREFGAIGNGLAFAIGVALAREEGKVVLFDGDGGLMMNIQELDTIERYGLRILVCCFNDGGFGAEFHRLIPEGIDDSGSRYGRTDLGAIAEGFGIRGTTIQSLDELAAAFEAFRDQEKAELWNIHVADTVMSPDVMRIAKGIRAARSASPQ